MWVRLYPVVSYALLLVSAASLFSCTLQPPLPPLPASPPPRALVPAGPQYRFELGALSITPAETEAGGWVQVQIPLRNTGQSENAYVGTLYVDGQENSRQAITLAPGNTGALIFQVVNLVPGNHKLSVGESSGLVRVYKSERFVIANAQIIPPRYTRVEDTPSPPLPHISTQTFSSPMTPFFIRQIDFRYPYPASFKVLDTNNRLLYSGTTVYAQSAFVPFIEVGSDFVIQLETDQVAADIRSQFFDYSSVAFVVAFYWPQVSIIEGICKRFTP